MSAAIEDPSHLLSFVIQNKTERNIIVKCLHCDEGYRHVVGDCVICGLGPAPGGNWRAYGGDKRGYVGQHSSRAKKEAALEQLRMENEDSEIAL